jgi:hypothetical protein
MENMPMSAVTLDSVKTSFNTLNFTVKIEPSTEDQIKAVEQQLGITFPPSYRDFLLWMGNRRAGMLFGTQWFLSDLPLLRGELSKALAKANFPAKLPDDALVFWNNQGEEYNFIRLSQGDNSPVYRYHTTLELKAQDFPVIFANFPEWLLQKINDHVKRMRSLGKPY